MKRILLFLAVMSAAFALTVEFTAPTGDYEHGSIPVEFTASDGDDLVLDQAIDVMLYKGDFLVETKTLDSASAQTYKTSFEILESGDYTISAEEMTTAFTVTTSQMYVDILKPMNASYDEGEVEVRVSVTMDQSFVHGTEVTAQLNSGTPFDVPEGQNYYFTNIDVSVGQHTLKVTAVYETQTIEQSVPFWVPGIIEDDNGVTPVPGTKWMEIERESPTRGQYASNEEIEVEVFFTDETGTRMRDGEINATLTIKTPSRLYSTQLGFVDHIEQAKYSKNLVLDEDGFWELSVRGSKEGYETVYILFPAIRVGEEAPALPEGSVCDAGVCMEIISPEKTMSYPVNKRVEMRVQVLEESGNHEPINDATVTATIGEWVGTLEYEWNGMYVVMTEQLEEGNYMVDFSADSSGRVNAQEAPLYVSPNALQVRPVFPEPDGNVTTNIITIKAEVLDNVGDIVPGANARAIVTSPVTGAHEVNLVRNVKSGLYESKYTFSDNGRHSIKLVASKTGFVSGDTAFSFEVNMPEESFGLGENDIIVIAIIVGIVIILVTVGRALL